MFADGTTYTWNQVLQQIIAQQEAANNGVVFGSDYADVFDTGANGGNHYLSGGDAGNGIAKLPAGELGFVPSLVVADPSAMASGHSSSAMPNTSTPSLSRRNDPPRNKALLAEIFALDQPNTSGIEQLRAPAASRRRDCELGAASRNIAIIASGTALIQSRRTGVSSSALSA